MSADNGARVVLTALRASYALRTAVREANRTRGTRGWMHFVRRARAPQLPVLLLEDSGALVGLTTALLGVGLTVLTGNGIFDGHTALLGAPGVDRVIYLRTVHLGPDELLAAGKIAESSQADGADIATTIDDAQARVCDIQPNARIIYLEPDIYRPTPR